MRHATQTEVAQSILTEIAEQLVDGIDWLWKGHDDMTADQQKPSVGEPKAGDRFVTSIEFWRDGNGDIITRVCRPANTDPAVVWQTIGAGLRAIHENLDLPESNASKVKWLEAIVDSMAPAESNTEEALLSALRGFVKSAAMTIAGTRSGEAGDGNAQGN